MKKLLIVIAGLVIALFITFIVLRVPDTDPDTMRAKYAGPDSQFVEAANGMSVHYRDQGCRECPVILLIHGSNASLHTFEPLVDRLEDRYRLISFDQSGHGLTGPHPQDDYSAAGMFDALNAVIEVTGIQQYAVAGSSMGGWVAWRHTLEQPEAVTALVLISASGAPRSPDSEPPPLYLGARIMRHPIGRRLGQHITPRSLVEQSIHDSVVDAALVTDTMVDRYWELLRLPGNRRAAGLRAVADRESEVGERLNELTLPTLIIWGAEDAVVPLEDGVTFDARIPNSELVVFDNIGHLPMEELPDETASRIDGFLRSTQ